MSAKTRKWIIVPGVVALCLLAVVLTLAKLSGQFLKTQVEKALGENVKAAAVSISLGKGHRRRLNVSQKWTDSRKGQGHQHQG